MASRRPGEVVLCRIVSVSFLFSLLFRPFGSPFSAPAEPIQWFFLGSSQDSRRSSREHCRTLRISGTIGQEAIRISKIKQTLRSAQRAVQESEFLEIELENIYGSSVVTMDAASIPTADAEIQQLYRLPQMASDHFIQR